PADVRAAALQALGKWAEAPTKEQLRRLFACAADRDFRVAAPALMLLKPFPVDAKTRDGWLSLLKAQDKMVRTVAMEKLDGQDTADVAAGLMAQMGHADRGLREAALARLTKLKHGRAALTRETLETPSVDRAWALARAQAPFLGAYPDDWFDEVLSAACERLEADDRRADPLLFLLREADPARARDALEAKAVGHRKKKAY